MCCYHFNCNIIPLRHLAHWLSCPYKFTRQHIRLEIIFCYFQINNEMTEELSAESASVSLLPHYLIMPETVCRVQVQNHHSSAVTRYEMLLLENQFFNSCTTFISQVSIISYIKTPWAVKLTSLIPRLYPSVILLEV